MTDTPAALARPTYDEESMLRHAELARTMRRSSLGEMASALAHELNQPLAAIVNYVEAAVRELNAGTADPARVVDDLEQIRDQAIRAAEVIRRARSLVHREKPQKIPFGVTPLVAEVVHAITPSARHAGVTIRTELADDLPLVEGDPDLLRQVVYHVTLNGIEGIEGAKPSAAGGRASHRLLVVRSRRVPDGGVAVEVESDAATLDPDVADRVFEPFVTTKPGALGLGLAVARRIVDAHDGEIWVKRGPRSGTTVGFRLPPTTASFPETRRDV